ncbi:MAG TPA: paraquat-inducible protein A [Gammaproteobacteria bacterium]|nr:paraquat-inducible protein A [Gammaproteobacteria bacterium]
MKPLFRAIGVILLLVALAMLVVNLGRPILHVEKFWIFDNSVSIWSGMRTLYRAGEVLLGSLILVFSIVIPIGKNLLLIGFLMAQPRLGRRADWLVRTLAALGRWSMLDVLIVAVVVVSLRLGAVAQADILSPLYWFIASVLLTNLVSTTLDWRLAAERKGASDRFPLHPG